MQITAIQSQLTNSSIGTQFKKKTCSVLPKNYSNDIFSNSNKTNKVAFKGLGAALAVPLAVALFVPVVGAIIVGLICFTLVQGAKHGGKSLLTKALPAQSPVNA